MKHEHVVLMNNTNLARLITAGIKKYLPGIKITVHKKPAAPLSIDCSFDLEFADKTSNPVCVIYTQNLRPSTLPLVNSRFGENKNTYKMLVTDYVTPPIAENLRALKTWFLDEAGNIFIDMPGKIFIFDIGYKKKISARMSPLISATNAKIFFFLLKDGPRVVGTYRQMAAQAGISLGKIAQSLTDLKQREFIHVQKDGIIIRQPLKLLELWVQAYLEKLKPQMYMGTYTWPHGKEFAQLEKSAAQINEKIGIGGEYGGEILTGYLQAATMDLWLEPRNLHRIRKSCKLMESEKGSIQVYSFFAGDRLVDSTAENDRYIKVIHPLIVYADLLGTPDSRCRETAKMIRNNQLEWIHEIGR